jgi:hypothetical protein
MLVYPAQLPQRVSLPIRMEPLAFWDEEQGCNTASESCILSISRYPAMARSWLESRTYKAAKLVCCNDFEGSELADTYRITPQGDEFMVNQNAGVTVGVYNTKQEAQLTVEDCERDDFMLGTARSLVNTAVEAQMRLHHIDRRAAHDWIREAAD